MALFAIAAITRRARFHEVLVSVNVVLLAIYIGALFIHMPGR